MRKNSTEALLSISACRLVGSRCIKGNLGEYKLLVLINPPGALYRLQRHPPCHVSLVAVSPPRSHVRRPRLYGGVPTTTSLAPTTSTTTIHSQFTPYHTNHILYTHSQDGIVRIFCAIIAAAEGIDRRNANRTRSQPESNVLGGEGYLFQVFG